MKNISALIAFAVATTGEEVLLSVAITDVEKYIVTAELRNDANDVMTMASDWDRLFTFSASSVEGALTGLDALCAEDFAASQEG